MVRVSDDLDYIWTSGRLCDFPGCDRADLQPVSVNGWFWTGSNKKIAPTNSTPATWDYQPWSPTGNIRGYHYLIFSVDKIDILYIWALAQLID